MHAARSRELAFEEDDGRIAADAYGEVAFANVERAIDPWMASLERVAGLEDVFIRRGENRGEVVVGLERDKEQVRSRGPSCMHAGFT